MNFTQRLKLAPHGPDRQKLGTFRKRHAAIGAGAHKKVASPAGTYAFTRTLQQGSATDTVLVVLAAPK